LVSVIVFAYVVVPTAILPHFSKVGRSAGRPRPALDRPCARTPGAPLSEQIVLPFLTCPFPSELRIADC
jgi:hypothetical protein